MNVLTRCLILNDSSKEFIYDSMSDMMKNDAKNIPLSCLRFEVGTGIAHIISDVLFDEDHYVGLYKDVPIYHNSSNNNYEMTLLNVKDAVSPSHYKNQTSLECIESMIIIFGEDAVYNFCACNAWKYLWRWRNIEDLNKAEWYIEKAFALFPNDDQKFNRELERMYEYIENVEGHSNGQED